MMRFLLPLLLFSSTVYAQTGAIGGRVIDDLGDPLPGANVYLEGTQLGTATDVDGNFVLTGIPAGEYEVTVSFVGYRQHTEAIQISSGGTRWLAFELGTAEIYCGSYWYSDKTECDGNDYGRSNFSTDPFASRIISGERIRCMPLAR